MKTEMKNKLNCCHLIAGKVVAILLSVMLFIPIISFNVNAEDVSSLPRMVDYAGLLTEDEEYELEEKLGEISERQQLDVVIVTVESLEGKTATEYADDFFDYNGYGYGDSRDGILFLIGMEERKWAISTTGWGIDVFTDAGQEYMTDRFISYISDGEYYTAFNEYADICDKFITRAYEGEPYDVGSMPKTYFKWTWLLGSILAGFVTAFLMGQNQKHMMKSIIAQQSASSYTKDGSVVLTTQSDKFVTRNVVTRVIQDDDSKGGSSTHTSSSGSSHGGSCGSF